METQMEHTMAPQDPNVALEIAPVDATDDWLDDCIKSDATHVNHHVTNSGHNVTTLQEMTSARCPSGKNGMMGDSKEGIRTASKPHSTPLTLKWLEENYEFAEGVCIPRNALYVHYLDFCQHNDSQPVNAASFGKIIRQQFPQITTRRLGTRGQSKYHYYGIGVKESSQYYDVIYSRKGVQSATDGRKENVKQIVAYSPRSKLGTLLPEFPNVKDLKLDATVTEDKVTTFLMMYRTHCQRILDTVIRANFDEVQSFLLHFWQGMPQHIVPILGTTVIVNLVGVCDSILYKAISGVLMPTVLQALPDSLTQVIRKFARQLDDWLRVALDDLPETLRTMKFELARRFAHVLKRQTSLNHLCQASRTVIHSADITSQMLEDWSHVDLNSICKQTLYTMDKYSEHDHQLIIGLYKEFERLLHEQAPIEAYTEWLDSMVHRCVVQIAGKKSGLLRRIARQFLLMWSCFGTRVIRDMTLHSAPSFGSFHLLHLMFDEYVLYLVEALHTHDRAADLLRAIKGEDALMDVADDLALPYPPLGGAYCRSEPVVPPGGCMVPDRQTVITDAREAYGAAFAPTASPVTSSSRGGSTSPSHSSMTSYDARCEPELQLSPSADCHVSPAHMERGQAYGRYNTDSTGGVPDVNSYNPYPYTTGSQCGFTRTSSDWSERYGHMTSGTMTQDSNMNTNGNYNAYSYARGGDYDMSGYSYDSSGMYQSAIRCNPQTAAPSGVYTQYSGVYGVDENTDSSNRKRKLTEVEQAYAVKRSATTAEGYDYNVNVETGFTRT